MMTAIIIMGIVGLSFVVLTLYLIAKLWYAIFKAILVTVLVVITLVAIGIAGCQAKGKVSDLFNGTPTVGESKNEFAPVRSPAKAVEVAVVRIQKYRYYWELPKGVYVDGRNKISPKETTLELVQPVGDVFYLDQPYFTHGKPERMRIRLRKVGEKRWSGPWSQDNPEQHGNMELREDGPGSFSGSQTFVTRSRIRHTKFCSIVIEQSQD
jgi:hypothetical protein